MSLKEMLSGTAQALACVKFHTSEIALLCVSRLLACMLGFFLFLKCELFYTKTFIINYLISFPEKHLSILLIA